MFFKQHGAYVLPAAVNDESDIRELIAQSLRVSVISGDGFASTNRCIHLVDLPSQIPLDASFPEFKSEDELRSRLINKVSKPVFQPNTKYFVLLMTQRVGSSWLVHQILNTQRRMYWQPEILLDKNKSLESTEEFIDRCKSQKPRAYICGFKATLPQLQHDRRTVNLLRRMDVQFVVLRRRSVARQALSLSLAQLTNNWGCTYTSDASDCLSSNHINSTRVAANLHSNIVYIEETYERWCYFLRDKQLSLIHI